MAKNKILRATITFFVSFHYTISTFLLSGTYIHKILKSPLGRPIYTVHKTMYASYSWFSRARKHPPLLSIVAPISFTLHSENRSLFVCEPSVALGYMIKLPLLPPGAQEVPGVSCCVV